MRITTRAATIPDIIIQARAFLEELSITGIALAGSRASGQAHEASDYDLLVLSNTLRSLHIEDILLQGHKVQLFILPLRSLDTFLTLSSIAGSGTIASMLDTSIVLQGHAAFTRIKTNLSLNTRSMEQVERNTVNRNIHRLRNRMSKLIKDLKGSTDRGEDLYTGAELFKTAGQFLLARRSKFFLPSEKHLHKELIKFYPASMVQGFGEAYSRSVKNADYSALISYCTEVVLEGDLLRSSSSSMSCVEQRSNLGCNIIYINSHSSRLIKLIYGLLTNDRPQLVLNEDRDLLHPGVYFIVDIHDFHTFFDAFKTLPLAPQEADLVTLNYQLDPFLLEHFNHYAHDGLLSELTQYVMEHDLDRNVVMNSVLDWMLNAGISIFSKERFIEYVRACHGMYMPSMPHEPETFDLNRVSDRSSRSEAGLKGLDLSPLIERYWAAVDNWSCMDLADKGIRKRIVEAYRETIPSAQFHSVFRDEAAPFSNFYHLFESIFNTTLLPYRERGLLYHSLKMILEA